MNAAGTTGGTAGASGGSSGASATGGSGGNTSTGTGGAGGAGGADAGGAGASGAGAGGAGGGNVPPTADGTQLAPCSGSDDCDDGLNCYAFGGYCSAACADDADCTSLGDNYTCSMSGPMGGGFGGPSDGGTASGVCRAVCEGADDTTSCPTGLVCVERGGGGGFGMDGGMATGRCAYPEEDMPNGDGGGMASAGTTPAFGECEQDGDCIEGYGCTAGNNGSGYCAQDCASADCSDEPSSGSATVMCSFGDLCRLQCSMDMTCPDGMTCNMFGGGMGGGGMGFCNY